jgi:NAD(P)-dependent dehydrogenase (short-subunit alcohol dehydrogenase family)
MGSDFALPAKKTINKKSVLITGTNKGIGFETAKQLL